MNFPERQGMEAHQTQVLIGGAYATGKLSRRIVRAQEVHPVGWKITHGAVEDIVYPP